MELATKLRIAHAVTPRVGRRDTKQRNQSLGRRKVAISKFNYIWLHTDTDYLGEVAGTGRVAETEEIQYYHPPARWEGGLKGPRFMEYPLADEYAIKRGEIALVDAITVSDITKAMLKKTQRNDPQAAKPAWEERLNITNDEWKHVAKLYTLPLLKHTDKHMHFKRTSTSPTDRRRALAGARRRSACQAGRSPSLCLGFGFEWGERRGNLPPVPR